MAIYLDTSVLWGWHTFAELDCLALSIVAEQIGQPIVVPGLAADEAEGHYRRSVEGAVEAFESAEQELHRWFKLDYVHVEPSLRTGELIEKWRRGLTERYAVPPLHPDDAIAALRREIDGVAPAKPRQPKKPGAGGRDAAIWLSILRDHAIRDEEGHFVAKDGDFRNSRLRLALPADLPDSSCAVHLYSDVTDLLEQLGQAVDKPPLDMSELQARAFETIAAGLHNSPAIQREVAPSTTDGWRFRAEVKDGEVIEIVQARRYEQGADTLTVVNAKWRLTANCWCQKSDTDTPNAWYHVEDARLEGWIQVYLTDGADSARSQFIGAQLDSDTHASFDADGRMLVMTRVRN